VGAQAVIDAQIIPPLIKLLATAEFDIQKEAAWAISNATSGGSHEQIKYAQPHGNPYPLWRGRAPNRLDITSVGNTAITPKFNA